MMVRLSILVFTVYLPSCLANVLAKNVQACEELYVDIDNTKEIVLTAQRLSSSNTPFLLRIRVEMDGEQPSQASFCVVRLWFVYSKMIHRLDSSGKCFRRWTSCAYSAKNGSWST